MKIRTKRGVVAFAGAVIVIAVVVTRLSLFIGHTPELVEQVLGIALTTAAVISAPIALFVGAKIRENTLLTDELARLLSKDRLTQVATRDFFFRRMEADPDAYGVSLMVDVDYFKRINDTHGHLIGDKALSHVAEQIRSNIRANDIVCRFGGEEFVVFLERANTSDAYKIAEKVRHAIEDTPFERGDERIRVTVSIGASLRLATSQIEAAIHQADNALYKAKSEGRNRTVMTPSTD